MPVSFEVTRGGEPAGRISAAGLVKQLAGQGENATPSADGMTLTFSDGQGTFTKPVSEVLDQLGMQIANSDVIPDGAGFNTVSGELRAGVAKLPSDSMRKAYLEQSLQAKGMTGAQVMGSGRDWYFFNPQSGKYQALTNTPGWDRYDAVEGAMDLPRLAASAGGAALGGMAMGALALPGAFAGSALGDIGTRFAMGQVSPEYKEIAGSNMGQMGKDVLVNATIDTLGLGAAKYAPAAIGAVFPGAKNAVSNAMNKGIISPITKAAGTAVESVTRGVGNVAKAVNTQGGRSVATMGIPGAGEAEIAGELMNLPGAALRNLPKGMQALGSKPFMQEYFPAVAEKLRRGGQNMFRASAAATPETMAQKVANTMAVPGAEEAVKRTASAPAVARVLGERAARGTGRMRQRIGQAWNGTDDYIPNPVSQSTVKKVGRAAESVGRGAQAASDFGTGVAQTARSVAGVGLKGVEGVARAGQAAGAGARIAGTLASPLESRYAMQQGGDYLKDKAMGQLESLQRRRMQANIDAILAGN